MLNLYRSKKQLQYDERNQTPVQNPALTTDKHTLFYLKTPASIQMFHEDMRCLCRVRRTTSLTLTLRDTRLTLPIVSSSNWQLAVNGFIPYPWVALSFFKVNQVCWTAWIFGNKGNRCGRCKWKHSVARAVYVLTKKRTPLRDIATLNPFQKQRCIVEKSQSSIQLLGSLLASGKKIVRINCKIIDQWYQPSRQICC